MVTVLGARTLTPVSPEVLSLCESVLQQGELALWEEIPGKLVRVWGLQMEWSGFALCLRLRLLVYRADVVLLGWGITINYSIFRAVAQQDWHW